MLHFRGYYVVVVPLKKQRGGKFLNPWEEPDQMNLDEVRVLTQKRASQKRAVILQILILLWSKDLNGNCQKTKTRKSII